VITAAIEASIGTIAQNSTTPAMPQTREVIASPLDGRAGAAPYGCGAAYCCGAPYC